jgi:Nucleotidyl transferase AbiEii toxin, Type IV TA system
LTDRLPKSVRDVLPGHTAEAWPAIVPYIPKGGYLAGGTAIAVYLGHRISRDLDIFTSLPFDEPVLRSRLVSELDFFVSDAGPGTINGYLGETKVQFLDASTQRMLGEPSMVAGMPVAQLEDLMATKIKVIGDRGELRDYFDLMEIERRTDLTFEEGLGDYLDRYEPQDAMSSLSHVVRVLSSFGDVADDPALPVNREEIEAYWTRRAPDVAQTLTTYASLGHLPRGGPSPHPLVATSPRFGATDDSTCERWMPRAKTRCVEPRGHAGGCRSKRSR